MWATKMCLVGSVYTHIHLKKLPSHHFHSQVWSLDIFSYSLHTYCSHKDEITAIPSPASRHQLAVNDLTLDSNKTLIHLQVRGTVFYIPEMTSSTVGEINAPGNKNRGQEHWPQCPEQVWARRAIVHHGKATRLSTIKDMKQMPTCSCWTWLGSRRTGSPWGALIHPLHLLPREEKGRDGQEYKPFLPPCHTPALASPPSLQSLAFTLLHSQMQSCSQ